MGSTPQELYKSTNADVNLVISDTGILAARYLKETYGIPFVAGAPVTRKLWAELARKLMEVAEQPLQLQQDETAFLMRLDAAGRQYDGRSVSILIGGGRSVCFAGRICGGEQRSFCVHFRTAGRCLDLKTGPLMAKKSWSDASAMSEGIIQMQ
jgi:nitrogenase molybdenum-iron protein alpha/beta subunit